MASGAGPRRGPSDNAADTKARSLTPTPRAQSASRGCSPPSSPRFSWRLLDAAAARFASPWRWSSLTSSPPEELEESHETLVDVFLRIRPPNQREQGERLGVRVEENSVCVEDLQSLKRRWFSFETIINSAAGNSGQPETFDAVGSPAVKSVLNGFDTCIFSLGQTGTGKTFTLVGLPEEPGLLPRAVAELFKGAARSSCKITCLELHMDRVRDLLLAEGAEVKSTPEIRCVPGRGVHVSHLTEVVATDPEEAVKYIYVAAQNRAVARTGMNDRSSRGHAVFQISMEAGAKLCVVDLAGRENEKTSGCSGQSLAELGYINKSLFHLTNVIQALAAPGKGSGGRVPFRDSKLTLLLSEYLQNARTFLVATASPAASSVEETLATLRLAQAVRQITTRSRRKVQAKTASPGPSFVPCTGLSAATTNVGASVAASTGTSAATWTAGPSAMIRLSDAVGMLGGPPDDAPKACESSQNRANAAPLQTWAARSTASLASQSTRSPCCSKAATEAAADSDRCSDTSGQS